MTAAASPSTYSRSHLPKHTGSCGVGLSSGHRTADAWGLKDGIHLRRLTIQIRFKCLDSRYIPYLQPSAFALNAIKHPFSQLVKDRGTFGPWKAVNYVSHLRPGDILVNNAHVMIVMEKPKELGDKGSRWHTAAYSEKLWGRLAGYSLRRLQWHPRGSVKVSH